MSKTFDHPMNDKTLKTYKVLASQQYTKSELLFSYTNKSIHFEKSISTYVTNWIMCSSDTDKCNDTSLPNSNPSTKLYQMIFKKCLISVKKLKKKNNCVNLKTSNYLVLNFWISKNFFMDTKLHIFQVQIRNWACKQGKVAQVNCKPLLHS